MTSRISILVASSMVFMAVILDVIQFFISMLPLIGLIVSSAIALIALVFFGIWFGLLGVNYFGGRKAHLKIIAALGASASELIPIFNMLPAITTSVLVIIFAVWLEDRPETPVVRQTRALARTAKVRYEGGKNAIRGKIPQEQAA